MKRLMVLIVGLILLTTNLTYSQWTMVYPDKPLWVNSVSFVSDTKVYAAGLNGLWLSENAGQTWKENADWNTLLWSYQNIAVIGNNIWLTTYGNSFLKSANSGSTWEVVVNGTADGVAYKTFWLDTNNGYACGATEKLFGGDTLSQGSNLIWKTSDGGKTWSNKSVGKDYMGLRDIILLPNGNGYATSQNKMYQTSDFGNNWLLKNFNLNINERFCKVFFFNNNEGIMFNSSIERPRKSWIYRTHDGGNSWLLVSKLNDFAILGHSAISVGDNIIITGRSDVNTEQIYRSIDSAKTWSLDYSHPINGQISLFAITSRGRVAVAAGNYIFRSDNSLIVPSLGDSIVTVGQNFIKQLPKHDFEGDSLIYNLKSAPNFLKIEGCCITGIPSSSDTGTYTVTVEVTDTRLNTTSSFKLTVDKTVGVEDNNQLPTKYVLNQNYPNPFNPTTTINYSLPKSGNVRLVVVNSLGQEITTLVNEFKSVGSHNVQFNGANLSSGIYFYRIIADSFTQTKKMILVK